MTLYYNGVPVTIAEDVGDKGYLISADRSVEFGWVHKSEITVDESVPVETNEPGPAPVETNVTEHGDGNDPA